jgi:hypothetical protein
MSFGQNTNHFAIKEGTIKIGTWTTPNLIGDGSVGDPGSLFTGVYLGNFQQGTINIALNREFAEALSNTPAIILRKDLTRKMFYLECSIYEQNVDIWELCYGLFVQKDYSAAGWYGDIGKIGSDEPVQPYYGYLIESQLVNGNAFNVGIFKGKVVTEDVSQTRSGTEHIVIPVRVDAFPDDDNFELTGVDAQKHYGVIWKESTTSAS